jgi:hypothetical protein
MSFSYAVMKIRIQQAVKYIKKNLDARRAKVARDFDASLQRIRFRLLEKLFASAVREVHDKKLTFDQNLTSIIYIRKLITFDLNFRLNIITFVATKLFMQDASKSFSSLSISHV